MFGAGTGPIWLSHVGCVGNENALEACPHPGWGIHGCGHGEDVSITCNASAIGELDRVKIVRHRRCRRYH